MLSAIVPGFLLGYRGEAMMPEYSRYMKTIPFFIMAYSVTSAMSAYGLVQESYRPVRLAFAIFMSAFSVRILTQRLIRVRFQGLIEPASPAPFSVRLNAYLVAATLAMMGTGYMQMEGEFDTPFFDMFGVSMIGLSAAWVLSLRRSKLT